MRTLLPLLSLLLLPACPGDPTCDADATELGVAGEFDRQSMDFEFSWSGKAGVSVGPELSFEVADDTTAIAATVVVPGVETGFALWSLDGEVLIDATSPDEHPPGWWSEPYYHWGALGSTLVMPITPDTVPWPGCLVVQPAALDDLSGQTGTLHLVSRRYAIDGDGAVNVNIVVVGDTELYQEDLDDALDRMASVWAGGGGPDLGTVDIYALEGDALLMYADSEALRRTPLDGADPQSMTLFFVTDYADEPGTLGEAGGIPGPLGLQGVDAAGVILAVDGHSTVEGDLDTSLLGETMAHEVGHQMGLFHTTESDGTRTESLDDTPDCPPEADLDGDGWFMAEECADWDGGNFMFWVAGDLAQDEVSDSQGLVLSHSPVTH